MIKKIAVSLLFSIFAVGAFPQFAATGTGSSIKLTGSAVKNIDAVFLFNGITADNQVEFTGNAPSFLWEKFDGSFVGNTRAISVEDATGYVLTANGTKYYIWIIDYHNYIPSLTGLTPTEGVDKCTSLTLKLSGNIPELAYRDKNNTRQVITRQFTLSYPDLNYASGQWTTTTKTQIVSTPFSSIAVDAPYSDTNFQLNGDQFANQFGSAITITSGTYSAIRTECHLVGEIVERDAKNEVGRKVAVLEGSGPLNVNLKSNANLPVTRFYEWKISETANPAAYLRYTDTDLRYTFNKTGEYKVLLTVTNTAGTCSFSDSVAVKVSASYIDVPNVFTPNGDGKNDQFRVAYRSIADYQIVVYSSWAGRVYISTNPAEGWDGRVGGKLSPPGAYYYIITATGTDGKKFKLKGNVNLLREKGAK